ncbi:polyphosphate kinase [Lasius niger]|uniref:Polyphosphate kinase n=1 Tax=Lasius niger TaxID=67767 RepID=A0A0J7MY13_LASNI|nr:polyphosphate kinase [Lasius niger]
MVAAQPHALARQANLIRQTPKRIAELGRRLAGIAAELIDLVGGRFHQHRRAAAFSLPQRGLQNPGMGGTDGKNPDRHTGLVLLDKL